MTKLIVAFLVGLSGTASAAPKVDILYNFQGASDGANPQGSMVKDAHGNLYGVTTFGGSSGQYGTVFELSPPAAGKTNWTEQVIWRFNNSIDGRRPYQPTIDRFGALYIANLAGGSASCGGGCGTILKLSPPVVGQTAWTETVLLAFQGTKGPNPQTNGLEPQGPVTLDAQGNVYDVAFWESNNGYGYAVYRLSPPTGGQGQWTGDIIYRWAEAASIAPTGRLIVNKNGILYGVSSGAGSLSGLIYSITPPAPGETKWTVATLANFPASLGADGPNFAPVVGPDGTFYGTTEKLKQVCELGSCLDYSGSAWSASPTQAGSAKWKLTTIYPQFFKQHGSFPDGELIRDSVGDLYGTTVSGGTGPCAGAGSTPDGCGVVFRLAPPASGVGPWHETILHQFNGAPDGAHSEAGLIAGKNGVLYGTTFTGGNTSNQYGTVFAVTGSGFKP